jgi:gamma-glutamyltranspeptidase/glutathione hydrolase
MLHWWIESMRMAFADRAAHMGDPDFHEVPVAELLSSDWIAARRISIGERAHPEVAAWQAPVPESLQTTHLSVLDRDGNAVAMTTTLNGLFGSGILVRGGGYFLNNELDDFAIQAGVPNQFGLVGNQANSLQPRKRPLSSMSPTVVRDAGGRVRLVLGSPGGPRIITSTLQVILRVFVLDQELGPAVRAPRLHQQWSPSVTRMESEVDGGWALELVSALEARGHELEFADGGFGSVQAILVTDDGEVQASSDPRRGGAAGLQGVGVSAPALPEHAWEL